MYMQACLLSHILTIFTGTVVQRPAGSVSIHQQLVLCVQPLPTEMEELEYSAPAKSIPGMKLASVSVTPQVPAP